MDAAAMRNAAGYPNRLAMAPAASELIHTNRPKNAVRQTTKKKSRYQDQQCIRGESRGRRLPKSRQMQNQEAGHHRVMHIDESDRNAGSGDRSWRPRPPRRMGGWLILFRRTDQNRDGRGGGNHLHDGGTLERAEPLAHHRPR